MLFPLQKTTGYIMSICLIADDVNFSLLVKGVTASFLHHKVTIFPFVLILINIYFGRDILTPCKYFASSLSFYPLTLASIWGFCLQQFCYDVLMGEIYFPHPFHIC